jgi:acid phosphatase type 7
MKSRLRLLAALGSLAFVAALMVAPAAGATAAEPTESPFLVKPYLQLGDPVSDAAFGGYALLWHAADADGAWTVEYQSGAATWTRVATAVATRVAVKGVPPHRVYRAALVPPLVPGTKFAYRVKKDGVVVFTAEGRARKSAEQPYRFVAFGDCGTDTPEQKEVAFRAFQARPDFVLITGDIVYDRGRISEYRDRFWPMYNADEPSPAVGAPLMRSTLFIAAPGNHDVATRDLGRYPDGLAYFLYWAQPLNGPVLNRPAVVPALVGPEANQQAFLEAAGKAYPGMVNFSFDYGNAHWTVIDSNPYVDWTDRDLRAWVEHDLAAARGKTWRFVAFHHPGFNSSKTHFEQQQMRLMADVFEKGGVDFVFNGHVHNYQRTFPLHFVTRTDAAGKPVRERDRIAGEWSLDKKFDGQTRTRPDGVIYLITGAGGNYLYNPEQQDDPASWQGFTHKYFAKTNSFTVVDVNGSTLTVRQVSAGGEKLDQFIVTK